MTHSADQPRQLLRTACARLSAGLVLLVLTATPSCDSSSGQDDSDATETGGAGASASTSTGTATGSGTSSETDVGGSTETETVTHTGPDTGTDSDTGTVTDRPYANVVAVSVSGASGDYTFDVSVESADIDCNQYTNWWEVLRSDGSLAFRRILEHCHTDENGTSDPDAPGNTFTRDGGPVPVLADEVVIVRAHMSNEGYNGQVMRGSASGSFTVATDLAPDFAADVETASPQPDGCLF